MNDSRYHFILNTAKAAGELILQSSQKDLAVSHKGDDYRNLLTEVDLKVNDFLKSEIAKNYPNEAIYSEEGADAQNSGSYWAIDPIDGTSNFSRGIPHFATAISFVENNEPIMGAVFNPKTQELFSFIKGEGAYLNEQPIHASKVEAIKESFVLYHAGRKPEFVKWGGDVYQYLLQNAKKSANFGSSSLDICFVAAGRVDAVIYGTLTTKDVAVALGILKEAGGVITNLKGENLALSSTPQSIVAVANNKLYEELKNLPKL